MQQLNTKQHTLCDLQGCLHKNCGPDNVSNSLITGHDQLDNAIDDRGGVGLEDVDLGRGKHKHKKHHDNNHDIQQHDRQTLVMMKPLTDEDINKDSEQNITLILADEETEKDTFFPKSYTMRRVFTAPRTGHGPASTEYNDGLPEYVQDARGAWHRQAMHMQMGLPLVGRAGGGVPLINSPLEDQEDAEGLYLSNDDQTRRALERDIQEAFNSWEGTPDADHASRSIH